MHATLPLLAFTDFPPIQRFGSTGPCSSCETNDSAAIEWKHEHLPPKLPQWVGRCHAWERA